MNGIIYYTKIRDEYNSKNMEHMIGEKLLEIGLEREFGRKLAFEPRSKGEEVGIDVQIHKKVNYERILERMVPADMIREILDADDMEKAFFTQWVLRQAYIKWTGEGLSRDLRTISMDKGNYIMLELEPGYSGAIWSRDSLELRFEYEDIILR